MLQLRYKLAAAALLLLSTAANAHYANMGLQGVSCYIYNGIKGTPQGNMIIRHENGIWTDHDNPSNHGNITVVKSQTDYDALQTKPKIGIVCAPDTTDSTEIGIPYVEMEPTDEDFYSHEQTVWVGPVGRPHCILTFCKSQEY